MRTPAKLMAIAAVCLLLGFGLCGTGMAFEDAKPAGPLIIVGALLLVIGFDWMIVDNIRGGNR
jgi:hypothetical protein